MSRAYSLKYPAEIKENMYFAIETFAGHPGLPQTCRLEENVLVTKDGPSVFTKNGAYGRGRRGIQTRRIPSCRDFWIPSKINII